MAHTHHKCARRRGGEGAPQRHLLAGLLEVFRMSACWQTAPIADCVVGGPAKGIKESGGFFLFAFRRAGTFLAGCSCWCLGTAGMEIVMHFVCSRCIERVECSSQIVFATVFYCFCSKRSSKIKAFENAFSWTSETRHLKYIQGQGLLICGVLAVIGFKCVLNNDSLSFSSDCFRFRALVDLKKKCVPIVMQMCAGSLIRLPASWSSINEMIWMTCWTMSANVLKIAFWSIFWMRFVDHTKKVASKCTRGSWSFSSPVLALKTSGSVLSLKMDLFKAYCVNCTFSRAV